MTIRRGGFTLAEVLISSFIGAVVTAGTMAAFVAAARMLRDQADFASAEATAYAVQTLERLRNQVACDSPWFTPPCSATNLPTNWTTDPFQAFDGSAYDGGTESMLKAPPGPARRCYRVRSDCGGDCYRAEVAVCWADTSGCPCP